MLFHRAETFNHIVSTTSFGGVGNKSDEMTRMFVNEAMELTRNLGHLDDSDRSSMYSAFSEFDSGNLTQATYVNCPTIHGSTVHVQTTYSPYTEFEPKTCPDFFFRDASSRTKCTFHLYQTISLQFLKHK